MGEKERILDGELAIDRIVYVEVTWFNEKICFTIQERFRAMKYQKFQDITITEFNHSTNQKGELFKLNAAIFLYGYFDKASSKIAQWMAIDSAHLLYRLVSRIPRIKTREQASNDRDTRCIIRGRNPRSSQDFLCFKFQPLRDAGVVLCEGNNS